MLSSLKKPDSIIYYGDEQQKVFTKDDPKFQNIINLNIQRNKSKLEMLKSVIKITVNDISQGANMLVYKYDQSGYASIYLPLNESSDGKYAIAQQTSPENHMAQKYGFLSATDNLVNYLNS